MKPRQIYAAPYLRETKELYSIHYFLEKEGIEVFYDGLDAQDRVAIKEHFDPYIDGDRGATLLSVWYQSSPVMVCKTGGRPDYEHFDKFITDLSKYREMIAYLKSLAIPSEDDPPESYDVDQDIEELNKVYTFEIGLEDLGPIANARYDFERWLTDWNSQWAWPYSSSFTWWTGMSCQRQPTMEEKQGMRWPRIQQQAKQLAAIDPSASELEKLASQHQQGSDQIIENLKTMLKELPSTLGLEAKS